MTVECYFLEPVGTQRVSLRRYASGSSCSGRMSYHNAEVEVAVEPFDAHAPDQHRYDSDPRWPALCGCGYVFQALDARQVNAETLYRGDPSGKLVTLHGAKPGAMWDAPWYPWKGADGLSLVVVCPDGHHWSIDHRAANCALPNDDVHRCWVRTGVPPKITVGKNVPGQPTCAAGAGSIDTGGYHGHLINGSFT